MNIEQCKKCSLHKIDTLDDGTTEDYCHPPYFPGMIALNIPCKQRSVRDCAKILDAVECQKKEKVNPITINLNDIIKVKLTPLGADIYYHQYDDIHKNYPKMQKHLVSRLPEVDKDGYTKFQLHEFISLYGEHIGMCKPNVIEPLDIVIVD